MKRFLSLITLLFIVSFTPEVFGQTAQPCNCDAVLKKDIIKKSNTVEQVVSELLDMTQQQFDEIKHDASMTASLPFADGLLNGSATYSDYQQHMSYLKEHRDYFGHYISTNKYESYITNPLAYSAWRDCMIHCNQNGSGLKTMISSSEEKYFTAHVGYHGDVTTAIIHLELEAENGTIKINNHNYGNARNITVSNQWIIVTVIRKDKTMPSSLTINAPNSSYEPIVLKSSIVNPHNPIISQVIFGKDKQVEPSSEVASIRIARDHFKPDKSYQLIVSMPFYKNHQRDCIAQGGHTNQYGYLATFRLFSGGNKIPISTTDSDYQIITAETSQKQLTSYINFSLSINPSLYQNKPLELIFKQDGNYWSVCDQNKQDPLEFLPGGFMIVKEIE